MPFAAPRVCTKCQQSTNNCKCSTHNWGNKQHRSSVQKLYNCKKWKLTRLHVLQSDEHLCRECRRNNKLSAATTVDHIQAVSAVGLDRFILNFYNVNGLQSLCKPCHTAKTSDDSRNR